VAVHPAKRHPEDFALWKRAGENRLLKWPSPWGDGYPGWHIECSAMSIKHLGDRFDVHTGGNDNKFPHHEDEIAQSEGAVGHPVVSVWVHGGFLQMGGQKMAKSARNIKRVTDLAEEGIDPLAFRWFTFQTRYRSEMDFTWEALETADQRVKQLRRHVAEWGPASDPLGPVSKDLDSRFREAVANDLDMPAAVKVVNDLDRSADVPPGEKRSLLASWDHVLGLDLEREARAGWEPTEEMRRLVAERDVARGSKDYVRSDELRDELQAMGLEVMDTAEGTRVRPRN
jgi:cysteinyl-tRNA synthetase